ncbi:MAG: prepilin-type N-terminal cleavage/methylation domain-containing protein [Deltaproteobacteria bacterium]|nr:prepilin-type N-terminal cleavage/methylation domain-containing protein [Deltaproteobacteria bacterium]
MNNKGFTLIELSVVVFLVTVMLLIAVPRVRDSVLTDGIQSTVNRLTNTARELRSEAVRNQTDYILNIDLSGNRLWTLTADATSESRDEIKKKAPRLPGDVKIADVYYFDHEKNYEGEMQIVFSRKGYIQPTVLHLSKGESSFTVIFHPFLQTIEILDRYMDYRSAD